MAQKKVQIQGTDCWLTVEPFIIYHEDRSVNTGQYVAFFNFSKPGGYLGRGIKTQDGKPATFATEEAAYNAAQAVAEMSINRII